MCKAKPITVLRLVVLFATATGLTAKAQGTAFTYQGRLNNGGTPANGIFDFSAGLYAINTGGTVVAGPITNSAVPVSNGLFTVTLDYGNAFDGTTYWLEVAVRSNNVGGFTILSPRQQLTPTPYAIFAEGANAAGLSGTIPSTSLAGGYGGAVNFTNPANVFAGNGAGLSNVNATALGGLASSNFWQLGGNVAAGGSQILGTLNDQPLDLYADGIRALRLILRTDATGTFSNAPNVVGGSSVNLVRSTAVGGMVAGGGGNDINGNSYPNQVNANFGTISGGLENTITTAGAFSTVAGGAGNTIGGTGSFIGGGGYDGTTFGANIVNADLATIGGGLDNQIPAGSRYAMIGGGFSNLASAFYATVSGGANNQASGKGAFVGGGGVDGVSAPAFGFPLGNQAQGGGSVVAGGFENYASGLDSTVAGGAFNIATGDYSTAAGGWNNFAAGKYSTVPGGDVNVANGNYSFAAGYNAFANNNGAFVWSDDSGTTTESFANNQFMVRASGGVVFLSGTGTSPTNYATGSAGVALHPGTTSWSTISDRNAKKNFQLVDTVDVLNKLAAIPIEQWNYKWEADTATPNLGPMAQDFKAAFYPGRDDKSISTLEFDGVELAAIQGLNRKLEEQKAQGRQKDAEIAELKARLEKLEQLISTMKGNTR